MRKILKKCFSTYVSNSKANSPNQARSCYKNSYNLKKISFISKYNNKILTLEESQQLLISKKYQRIFKSSHLIFTKNCMKRMWLRHKIGQNNTCLNRRTKESLYLMKTKKNKNFKLNGHFKMMLKRMIKNINSLMMPNNLNLLYEYILKIIFLIYL